MLAATHSGLSRKIDNIKDASIQKQSQSENASPSRRGKSQGQSLEQFSSPYITPFSGSLNTPIVTGYGQKSTNEGNIALQEGSSQMTGSLAQKPQQPQPQQMSSKVNSIYEKLQDRLKIRKRNDDSNFRKMMAEFQGLNTFVDARHQIQKMNLAFQKGFKSSLEVLKIRDKIDRLEQELKHTSEQHKAKFLHEFHPDQDDTERSHQGLKGANTRSVHDLLKKSKRFIEAQHSSKGTLTTRAKSEQANSIAVTDSLKEYMHRLMPKAAVPPMELKDDAHDFYNNLEKVIKQQSNIIEMQEYNDELLRRKQDEKELQLRELIKSTKFDLNGGVNEEKEVPNQGYFEEFHKQSQLAINKAVRESRRIYRQKMGLISQKEKLFTDIKETIIDKGVGGSTAVAGSASSLQEIANESQQQPSNSDLKQSPQKSRSTLSYKISTSKSKQPVSQSHHQSKQSLDDIELEQFPVEAKSFNHSHSSHVLLTQLPQAQQQIRPSQLQIQPASIRSIFSHQRMSQSQISDSSINSNNMLQVDQKFTQVKDVNSNSGSSQQQGNHSGKKKPQKLAVIVSSGSAQSHYHQPSLSQSTSASSSLLSARVTTATYLPNMSMISTKQLGATTTTTTAEQSLSPFLVPTQNKYKQDQEQISQGELLPFRAQRFPSPALATSQHKNQNNRISSPNRKLQRSLTKRSNNSPRIASMHQSQVSLSIFSEQLPRKKSFGTISDEVKNAVKEMTSTGIIRLRQPQQQSEHLLLSPESSPVNSARESTPIQILHHAESTPNLKNGNLLSENHKGKVRPDQMQSFLDSMKLAEGAYKFEKKAMISALAEAKKQFRNTSEKYEEPAVSSIREIKPNDDHPFKTFIRRNLKHKSMQISNY